MPPENIKDIQQRLHELNAEEARLLADIQVSLAGIERIHAQRRMEELTLAELHRKAEDDRHEREDRKSRTKQGNHPQAGNRRRDAEDQRKRPESAKRQRHRGPSNTYGGQGEQGIPVPIPGSSNHGNWNQRHNQPSGGVCKCSRVDVHCGGNRSACAVCKALGCAGVAQSRNRNRKRGSERHNNVPPVVSSAASRWPHDAAGIINIDADVMDSQG